MPGKRNIPMILADSGKLPPEVAERVRQWETLTREEQRVWGAQVRQHISEVDWWRAAAELRSVPFVDLDGVEIDPAIENILALDKRCRWHIIPVKLEGKRLGVVGANVQSEKKLGILSAETGYQVYGIMADPTQVENRIKACVAALPFAEQVINTLKIINAVSPAQAEQATDLSRATDEPIETILRNLGVAPKDIYSAISDVIHIPFWDSERYPDEPEAAFALPEDLQERLRCVVVRDFGDTLTVLMENPRDAIAIVEMEEVSSSTVNPVLGLPEQIAELRQGAFNPRSEEQSRRDTNLATTQPAGAESPNTEPQQPKSTCLDKRLIAGYNAFSLRLFSQLCLKGAENNVFVSPLSVATALAMTANGAAGQTRWEMEKTLGLGEMSEQQINEANAALRYRLQRLRPEVDIALESALWAQQGVGFNRLFLDVCRSYFAAQVTSLNFDDPNSVHVINKWVQRSTRGKIPHIIDTLPQNPALLLCNVLYFKSQWRKKFDRAHTSEELFHLPDGSTKTVPMMAQSSSYAYRHYDTFDCLSLPYGDEGRVTLDIFLPHNGIPLSEFLPTLTPDNWHTWMEALHSSFGRDGDIKLPRFKMEYATSLKHTLQVLGIVAAFDERVANFSAMCNKGGLWIDEVQHNAVIEVNEEGTKAAAATLVAVAAGDIQPPPPFTFIADRPFFFSIRDNRTQAILFLGTVTDP